MSSLRGDHKEKDRNRKRAERALGEEFSILSYPLFEQEDQIQDQPQEQAQEQPQEGQEDPQMQIPMSYIQMFSQTAALRSKVRNVFENLSNISYKILSEKYSVRSINKDDRDFQIENSIILVSRNFEISKDLFF